MSSNIRVVDGIVYFATAMILFFALFEYLFLDTYLKIFSITDYYVARGTLDAADPSLQWANGLMLSGIRPEDQGGRVLLPFLGVHRVSSLFLEPIGLGNFGCVVVFWAIARSKMEGQARIWSVAAGIALIILSDGRFNAYFLCLGILILLISPRITTPVVLASPFVLIFGLWLAAANAAGSGFPPNPRSSVSLDRAGPALVFRTPASRFRHIQLAGHKGVTLPNRRFRLCLRHKQYRLNRISRILALVYVVGRA